MNESTQDLQRLCTQELLLLLERAEELPAALEELSLQMDAPSFPACLAQLLEEKGISVPRLGELALLSRSFTYQLCSGVRAPGRDIVLRLALVLGQPLDETQRLLRTAQRGALYPRVRRDAIVIFCLGRGLGLPDADELLRSLGEAPLV